MDFAALAQEIKERSLKFANVTYGEYEMLSDVEHEMIIRALLKMAEADETVGAFDRGVRGPKYFDCSRVVPIKAPGVE